MIDAGLCGSFWAEAVITTNFICNRCPLKDLKGDGLEKS